MRKLIYISILLTFGFASAFGQGLYRLGTGSEFNEVGMVTPSGNDLLVFEINENNDYNLHQFDGFVYNDLGLIPNLPKYGDTNNEDFKIVDAKYFNDILYVLGHDFGPTKSTSPSRLITWDGSSWSDITTSDIKEANGPSKLIVYGGKLTVVGIFNSKGVLQLEGSTWSSIGAPLGTNQIDYILDAEIYRGRIYATGEFTRPVTGQRYNTAVFEGNEWRPIQTPPFVNKSKQLALRNGELLLTGQANVDSDYLKSFDGSGWNDISSGLENVMISEFWDIASNDNVLCLTGMFENKLTGTSFNYLTKDVDGWHYSEQQFTTSKIQLCENNSLIYAYGDFNYPGVHAIGEIGYHSAVISGKVYLDENNNCIHDGTETGLALARVTLNPGNLVTFADDNGLYEFPVNPGSYTITFEPGIKNDYGCGRLASITVGSNVNYEAPELNAVEKPDVVDLELSSQLSNGWKLVRGQYNEIKLNAHNNGSVTIKGATLQLKMGDWWNDVSISPTPTSIVDDEYTWNVSDLKKGDNFLITISGTIKAEISEYNDFCFTGDVDFPQTDISVKSNREAAQLTTTDKLDPITKQVDCGSWFTSSTEKIAYHIRFENEASQVINKVTVSDTFDSDLISTYVWDYTDIGTSTKRDIKMIKVPGKEEWRLLYTWKSTDANLAPAGASNNKNVGYATLKFELHELSKAKGIELCNRAQVILENSEPMYTNTVCSKATYLNVPRLDLPSQVEFYPNPADYYVSMSNASGEERNIDVLNQMGQVVHSFVLKPFEDKDLDISNLTSGIYMINIQGFETQKLVIQ